MKHGCERPGNCSKPISKGNTPLGPLRAGRRRVGQLRIPPRIIADDALVYGAGSQPSVWWPPFLWSEVFGIFARFRGVCMPKLKVEGFGEVEVGAGKRLVLAIEEDAQVDILHACGGNARCTTCRVEFLEGEPESMTRAEADKLSERGLGGFRLSCQITCDHDMTIRAVSRLEGSGRADAGTKPAAEINPPPQWIRKD